MIACLEILDYRYTFSWELDSILDDLTFKENLLTKFPLVVSTETGVNFSLLEKVWSDFIGHKKRGRPTEIRNSSADSTASYVAKKLNLKSQCFMINATCSSGSYALYTASLISLETNTPVVVFCGDSLTTQFDLWKFNSFGALDQQTGIPFDKSSKGFKMGSGAAILLVKHPSVKSTLDAKAVIKKFHFYTNPDLIANPGNINDLVNNFSDVNFKITNFWNAHSTGTPVGDLIEYDFFKNVCSDNVPIVSFKGYFGHCINGSNPLEIIMSIEGKDNNILKANKIVDDRIVNDDRIITIDQKWPGNNMIKATFGFGGRSSILEITLI
jgi:3-oxoacyl-[acyl-carrier-protein] synthase-1